MTGRIFRRAVPIITGAVAIGSLQSLGRLAHHQKAFEMIGGVLLVLAGLYMLNTVLFIFPSLAI